MNNSVLVLGESGTGKSTSIRTLKPAETFIISVIGKPLPFKGARDGYVAFSKDNEKGNFYVNDNYQNIIRCIKYVQEKREKITTLIIDDFQYIMGNEFMRRASEKGFDKFSEISNHSWLVLEALNASKRPLTSFVLSHSERDDYGVSRAQVIGKLLSSKISMEGMFTTVLHAVRNDDGFCFITQNDGNYSAKTPMGMFEDMYIDNDLQFVKDSIENY